MHILNGDVRLHIASEGDPDAPPVLLMHGILGSSRTWEWMVPRLADRCRVLRLDFRGHGESDRAPGRYQMADYVSDAVAVCEQVARQPCAAIGHSLGGGTAAALAQQRPELLRGILMEDPPLAMPDPDATGDDRNALLDAFALMRTTIPQAQASGMTAEQIAEVMRFAPSPSGQPYGEFLADDALVTIGEATLSVDASVLDPVLEGRLAEIGAFDPDQPIPVPVVAVAADPAKPDHVLTPDDLERLVATSSDVRAVTLAGSNHLIHDTGDQREAFWSIVASFLDSLD